MAAALYQLSRRHLNHQPSLLTNNKSSLLHWHYAEMDDKNFQIHGRTLFYLFILFSIILLATLLLLYARWFFRFRHHHASANQISHYNHSHAPHATHAPPKGLELSFIKAMPIILHQVSAVEREDEMECCICLGVFDDGDKVKVLDECNHRFHSDCVDRWLFAQSTCPLCRLSLKPPPSIMTENC